MTETYAWCARRTGKLGGFVPFSARYQMQNCRQDFAADMKCKEDEIEKLGYEIVRVRITEANDENV